MHMLANANGKTQCRWMSDRTVKVRIITSAGSYAYGPSFKNREDAIKTISTELGNCGWIPVIDGMIRTADVVGYTFFGESDSELAPVRVFFDPDDGRYICSTPFQSFDDAEEGVADCISNREWVACEGKTIRTSTVKSFGIYDMRGNSSKN